MRTILKKISPFALACFGVLGLSGEVLAVDKIRITTLTVTKPEPLLEGDQVVIKMTIRNVSSVKLNRVPWVITLDDQPLKTGAQGDIAEGASFNAELQWVAAAGKHRVCAFADPENTLQEDEASRANNSTPGNAQVPCSPLEVFRAEEQQLDYQKARDAGAQFNDNKQSQPTDCNELGVFNASRVGGVGALFIADCRRLLGGHAYPEAFINFRLKNGWKVKSAFAGTAVTQGAGFNYVTPPGSGSDLPYFKGHVWADSGRGIGVRVTIFIRGPKGTNPYQ